MAETSPHAVLDQLRSLEYVCAAHCMLTYSLKPCHSDTLLIIYLLSVLASSVNSTVGEIIHKRHVTHKKIKKKSI